MSQWIDVCSIDDLQPDSGVCALVNDKQIAIFHMAEDQAVYALDNYDPFGRAYVLSRGMIGDIQGEPMVASPLYKQHFSLKSGICLDDPSVSVATYPVRIHNGRVEIQVNEVEE